MVSIKNIFTEKSEATGFQRSRGCPLQESYGYHNTSGDLISPGESREVDAEFWANNASTSSSDNSRKVNLSSTLYHRMMAKKLMLNKQTNFNQSSESNLVCKIFITLTNLSIGVIISNLFS